MIIERESEIRILRNFCDSLFDFFSIIEISKKTGISRNWIYKVINKFEKLEILNKSGKKYKLDFSTLFCKRLKLLFDSEYLGCLKSELKERIFKIMNKIIFEINPESIVIIGSVAKNKQKKDSDIDFLVIGNKKGIPNFENCNIILLSPKELMEKYLKGDDFILSALIFGKIIFDKNIFIKLFENPLPIFSQEVIQEKIKYCEKLEERIYILLKTDEKKAKEELVYLALQVTRLILLRNKTFPRTKYELIEQIEPFNKKIAGILKELLRKKTINKEKILNYIKACMLEVR